MLLNRKGQIQIKKESAVRSYIRHEMFSFRYWSKAENDPSQMLEDCVKYEAQTQTSYTFEDLEMDLT